MIHEIKGINITGGYFDDTVKFTLYENNKIRTALVYGKNGSGKSSISKGIQEYSSNIFSEYNSLSFYDNEDKIIDFDEDYKKSIHVYNESYVNSNLKLEEDGLNTIVMFGEQIELDKVIKVQNQNLENLENSLNKKEEELKKFNDKKNKSSPIYYENRVISELKKDNGWAKRDADIKGNSRKSSVNISVANTIYNGKSSEKRENLSSKFLELECMYKKASDGVKIINVLKKPIHVISEMIKLEKLLKKEIMEPKVTDREKTIMLLIQEGEQKLVESAKSKFEKSDIEICPFCLQSISQSYKKDLIYSINQILNKEVEEHTEELKTTRLDLISMELKDYIKVDEELVKQISDKINETNDEIHRINDLKEQKIENIYTPIILKSDICELVKNLNQLIDSIEKQKDIYNSNIDEKNHIKNKLIKTNDQLTWFDIKDNYLDMLNQRNAHKNKVEEIKKLKSDIKKLKEEIKINESKKSNVDIAVDKINGYLEYIFFEKGRIKLQVEDNKYIVLSRGKAIKLKNLSIGERNAMSLCYFISKVQEKCTEETAFRNELFLVFDDPISSFDIENKVGIYSFMRYILSCILKSNENSRILIFTHEIEAMYHFEKLCKDIKVKYKTYEIMNKQLLNFNIFKQNEYSKMIEMIYHYAKQNVEYQSNDSTIGNTMRRVLEAFGTFSYKKGINELSCDSNVLRLIKNKKQKTYFENLMYRLVLNSESHFEELARSIPERDFFEFIDKSDKIRTAKDILSFIYLLNPLHLEEHLGNKTFLGDVKQWCKDIEND